MPLARVSGIQLGSNAPQKSKKPLILLKKKKEEVLPTNTLPMVK
jgi:hypothetical protein